MQQKWILHITPGELRAIRFGRMFLLVTAPVAFLLGSLSLAFKPLEPKPWLEFCVALGIALQLYALVALVLLWAQYHPRRKRPSQEKTGRNRPSSPDKNSDDLQAAWDSIRTSVLKLFGGMLLLGTLGIALFVSGVAAPPEVAPFWFDFGRLMGTGLLVSLGFFAAGNLVGFLFGLPRSSRTASAHIKVASPSSSASAGASTSSQPARSDGAEVLAADTGVPSHASVSISPGNAEDDTGTDDIPRENTNLEEISDWLTKIIVGVGLVELKDVPHALRTLSDFFSNSCGNEFCGPLFLMIGVFFFITGFIASYVLARIYLKLMIALTNRMLVPSLKKVVRETAELTAEKTAKQTAERVGKETKEELGPVRIRNLISEARSTINTPGASEEQLNGAIRLLDDALASNPSDKLRAGAMVEKARAMKRKALQKEGKDREDELQNALALLTQVREFKPDDPPAIYNTACYKALLGKPLSDIRNDLLMAFDKAPALREVAYKDSDFGDLRGTAEFRALVKPEEVITNQASLISGPNVTDTDLDGAIREIDLVLGSGPDQKIKSAALCTKADALRKKAGFRLPNQQKDRDELLVQSRALLLAAQEADPRNGHVPYVSAKLKLLQAGNIAAAIEDLKRAFELNPELKAQAPGDSDFPPDVRGRAEFQALTRS